MVLTKKFATLLLFFKWPREASACLGHFFLSSDGLCQAMLGLPLASGNDKLLLISVLMTAVGVGVSLFLTLILARSPVTACYFCLLVHGVNIALLFEEIRLIIALQGD